jgi:hypothetical protein
MKRKKKKWSLRPMKTKKVSIGWDVIVSTPDEVTAERIAEHINRTLWYVCHTRESFIDLPVEERDCVTIRFPTSKEEGAAWCVEKLNKEYGFRGFIHGDKAVFPFRSKTKAQDMHRRITAEKGFECRVERLAF